MYLANCAKFDIAYVVGRLSWYIQSPNQDHQIAIHRVLKYLRGIIDYGLCYGGFPNILEGFSDANWIFDSDEVKSTSGMFSYLEEVQFLGSLLRKFALLGLL